MITEKELLDVTFGSDSVGETPADRARTSGRQFVRSLYQLAEDSTKATGRRLSAWEAYSAYGADALLEVGVEGSALLAATPKSAGEAIRQRIEDLEVPLKDVANASDVAPATLERLLATDPSLPLRLYEKVAQVLGLDERRIGVDSEPSGNDALTVRLRTIGRDNVRLTSFAVTAIAEAGWVAATQARLEAELRLRSSYRERFQVSSNYGTPGYPAYRHGYYLAQDARDKLGLAQRPIDSLRELSEEILGVPIIQTHLGGRIAGVTVDTGTTRAIVLALDGENRTALTRRSTIAHELGHLLFDPADRLNHLRVDNYEDVDRRLDEVRDPVEQRANAFSVEFIAPQGAIEDVFRAHDSDDKGLAAVISTFGISFTAATHQISNAIERRIIPGVWHTPRLTEEYLQRWEAAEAYSIDMHPLRALRPSRRGRFSAVVVKAADAGAISWDTAAQYLESERTEVEEAAEMIRGLFPTLFR
jgi:Zn-dependent peptidase ImmA (M78 family)